MPTRGLNEEKIALEHQEVKKMDGNKDTGSKSQDERTFTQSELDAILGDRLARQKEK